MKKFTYLHYFIYPPTILLICLALLWSCKKDKNNEPDPVVKIPVVATEVISSVTINTAISGGTISSDEGSEVTQRGVCWSTSQTPTINSDKTNDGKGKGTFISSIAGLLPNTTYYLRAYATNKAGTAYGQEESFMTKSNNIPVLTTTVTTEIKKTTALSGGNISSKGDADVTARGICWSTTQNPTINDSKTSDGTGIGSFTSSITGLSVNTTYYIRAFATNSYGTAYGQQVSFTTLDNSIASVSTAPTSSIIKTKAKAGGNVTSDNGFAITERGVCFSTSVNPTIANTKIIAAGTTGLFNCSLGSLTAGTTYHIRAYATNSEGTAYGEDLTFTTVGNTVSDVEGNTYNTVEIGDHVWMAENLRATKYNNGEIIGTTDPATKDVYGEAEPKYQWAYNNDESNLAVYGRLYTGFAANDSRGVCPTSWHVASDDDWKNIEIALGMSQSSADNTQWRGTNEGSKLAGNAAVWDNGTLENDPGFGASGFNAVPPGYKDLHGTFYSRGRVSYWLTSSSLNLRIVDYDRTTIWRYTINDKMGASVRCVKD